MSAAVQFPKPNHDSPAELHGMEVLGRVVSSVAHDFNNLITGVLLYSDLLSKELPVDSHLQRHVAGIRRAGENGAALIQQLLSVARPQSNGSDLLSPGLAIAEMHDLLDRLVGENIELVLEQKSELPRVRMSAPQFHRILLNLVLNARDAMVMGGRITLRIRAIGTATAPEVELSVMDTGCGMDESVRNQIFQPFFTTKPSGSGTGLGLFTVQNIVSQSKGSLSVESEPGKGTNVIIRLPGFPTKNMSASQVSGPNLNSEKR